jgi:pyruvate kinase
MQAFNMMDLSKRTKIVCTIGPASEETDTLIELVKAGMNVCRLNFSHGTHEAHAELISRIRKVRELTGEPLTLLQDLQGPKIRVGDLPENGIELKKGGEIIFTTGKHSPPKKIGVSYPGLHEDVKPGQTLLLDDGMLRVEVIEVKGKDIRCKVLEGGVLTSHKGLNLPETDTKISAITDKDKEDLAFGIEQGVDWIALSFVQSADDIDELRELLAGYPAKIIAKIEKPQAIERFDAILRKVDGIMVARGDLGIELPSAKVPVLQKRMIEQCLRAGKPVVVATQMLNSMIESVQATRAEISDVANAVIDHADATMLSGETAMGKHPIEAVKTMADTIRETEKSEYDDLEIHTERGEHNETNIGNLLARAKNLKAVIAATKTGEAALLVSRYRPEVPIFLATNSERTAFQSNMTWGLRPFVFSQAKNEKELIDACVEVLLKKEYIKKQDTVLVVAGSPVGDKGHVELAELRVI